MASHSPWVSLRSHSANLLPSLRQVAAAARRFNAVITTLITAVISAFTALINAFTALINAFRALISAFAALIDAFITIRDDDVRIDGPVSGLRKLRVGRLRIGRV